MMANYTVDNDILIDVFQSDSRGIEIGFDSTYTSIPHPGSNKTIQGWQWDRRLWPDEKELEALEYAPSIWDPTSYFLTSGYWQSGIGYGKDLLLFSISDFEIDSKEYWTPKLNHGYFYNRQYEWYLFADDYVTEQFYNNQLQSGFQYVDLSYNTKPGIPIRVARYRRDEVTKQYELDIGFRKRVKFTGNTLSGVEANTQNDAGYISFENVEGFDPEFIIDYDYGNKPRAYLNGDYSEAIASSGEFSQYELLGIGDGYKNQFYTRYSPIDPSGSFELISYIGSGSYTVLNQINSVSDFQEADVNEYKLDSILGIVTLYSGYPPAAGEKIAARYTKGISIEYEPEKSRDYILAGNTNINPLYSINPKGFLTVGFESQIPASITLESDLPTSSNYLSSLAGRSSRLTATVRGSNGEVLPNQEVKFELVAPYLSSLVSDTAITDHNGEADIVFLPPQNIESMGVYTTEFRHSGSETVIDVLGLPIPTNESGVLLYEVHREDTVLGFPASGEDTELSEFLNGAGVYLDPDGTSATTTYEKLYRQQFDITDLETIDDTDSSTLSIGRKEIVYNNNPNHIHPHSGIQQDPVYSPMFPVRYSNTGTISSPDIELVYDTLLPDFNDEIKSYFAITETTDQVIAYVVEPYTGRRIYSNIISIDITTDDESDGIINCADSDDVSSGLFRETRNLNDYDDDWITDNTYNNLYDKYIDTRLASGEFGYKELELEDKTIALYHFNNDLSDSGPYGFSVSGYDIGFAEKAGYSEQAVVMLTSGENISVENNLLRYIDHHSGTMEFGFRTLDPNYSTEIGSRQYFGSLLSVNSDGEYNGPETFLYVSSGTSYLGLDYYINGSSIFDSDPVATSVPINNINILDNKWHQLKYTWKYVPDEVITNSGYFDIDLYLDNVSYIDRDNIFVEDPNADQFSLLAWERQTPAPITLGTGDTFYKVRYLNNEFFILGTKMEIQKSSDGINWTSSNVSTGFGQSFHDIAYNDIYVIVGVWGEIQTSVDGITWTRRFKSGFGSNFDDLYGITYGAGLFVAVGEDGQIQTSTDTVNWTIRTPDNSFGSGALEDFNGIAYGNGLLVAVGGDGAAAEVQTSPDGINWTVRTVDAAANNILRGIVFANNLFVAVGNSGTIQTSSDGITWTAQTPDDGFSSIFRGIGYDDDQNLFIAVGNAEIQTSPDGVTWTVRTLDGGFSQNIYSAAHGNNVSAIVGDTAEIQTSINDIDWVKRYPGTSILKDAVTSMLYANNLFFAGGTGTVQISEDRISWEAHNLADTFIVYGLAYGLDMYVAVGSNGKINTSSDGISWTSRISGFAFNFFDIAFGNGVFVAVGNSGAIRSSSDGVLWVTRTPDGGFSDNFLGITFGNNLFVAVGNGGEIQTSPDGITWTTREADDFINSFSDVTFGNNLFVAVGGNGEIQISSDGITWKAYPNNNGFGGGTFDSFDAVSYKDNTYIAVGGFGEIQTSEDGISWIRQIPAAGYQSKFYSVITDGDVFVIGGTGGEIQTSKNVYRNLIGKYREKTVPGYYDELRLTSGEQIAHFTFQPKYYLEYESYNDWFRRTRILDTQHLGLNTYLFSGDCPSTIPVGHRLKSSDTQVASEIGYRLFYDLNDSLVGSYYTASGLDTYEEYY